MPERFDVIVLGTGPAGGVVAKECVAAGLSVAAIDKGDFGGTCPLRGCEPKKVLVDAADAVARASNMQGNGVTGNFGLEWPSLHRFQRSFVEPIPKAVQHSLHKAGITTVQGVPVFTGANTLSVEGRQFEAEHIVIATGAQPRQLPVPGNDLALTSDDFFHLSSLPSRLVFVGGGFISFEFAHVAALAGAEVSIVHRSERVLRPFDPDLVARVEEASRQAGIRIYKDTPVHSLSEDGSEVVLTAGPEGTQRFVADAVVNAIGRVPSIDGLDLENAGIEWSEHGVRVNEFMQSVSNPAIYAAGDVAEPGQALTPVAVMHAETVVHNILNGPSKTADHSGTAATLFTYPPLARVGMLESEARETDPDCVVKHRHSENWSEYQRLGQQYAGYKIVFSGDRQRVLGAHLLGDGAEEVANVFALAVRKGLSVASLQDMLWAYPSFGYTLRHMLG
ncbi:dihydrolipoyl dehydrogenase family protein [Desulfohalobium retbaense]|uniref:FAD-dependent pyridine nucleotide-disulphide oxidoreductase n=1 Tax=Desulfohalobium retbaense (strain ATCC 49708 / DSM 5692 / JCM 16813 / HR100) TaxID=485915 RepID=C8X2H7_DESRD|nr:NAD(P)/FAD-dependent oxidoreductase [Desulfohalobium retbaense]ACV68624.1 FAD-dependent pyridine nucleotide-disulphide oxidoreductase [Desulfohalobium retbaense DSM 5692]